MSDPKCGHTHTTEIGGEQHLLTCLAPLDHTGMHRWMSTGGALLSWPNERACGATIQSVDGLKVCRLNKPHGSPHMDELSVYLWLDGQETILTEREQGREGFVPAWKQMFVDNPPQRALDAEERPAEVRHQEGVARTYAERKKGRR